ncbi:MAG: hypothetical protein H6974_08490 [Gammaproteobacteria bacterium]|nr:hypothetical protein [Gammaproteobacteria bacterium]
MPSRYPLLTKLALLSVIPFTLLLSLSAIIQDRWQRSWYKQPSFDSEPWDFEKKSVMQALSLLSNPGERMAIWGWMAEYWVLSGLIMGTREASTEFAIRSWPLQGYYRKRFLDTLMAEKPLLLLEAIGPGNFAFQERSQQGIASFSELKKYVIENYHTIFDVSEAALYMRKDEFSKRDYVIPKESWVSTGDWMFGTAATPELVQSILGRYSYVLGSYLGSDTHTGIAIATLEIQNIEGVIVPLLIGPDIKNLSVRLVATDLSKDQENSMEWVVDSCDLTELEPHVWQLCVLKASLDSAKVTAATVEKLELRDQGSGWGQWLAIGVPTVVRKR